MLYLIKRNLWPIELTLIDLAIEHNSTGVNPLQTVQTGGNKDERNITADDVKYAEWFCIKEAQTDLLK